MGAMLDGSITGVNVEEGESERVDLVNDLEGLE